MALRKSHKAGKGKSAPAKQPQAAPPPAVKIPARPIDGYGLKPCVLIDGEEFTFNPKPLIAAAKAAGIDIDEAAFWFATEPRNSAITLEIFPAKWARRNHIALGERIECFSRVED